MIRHQAIGVARPIKSSDDLGEHSQKKVMVAGIEKNSLLPITPGGDMVQGIGKL